MQVAVDNVWSSRSTLHMRVVVWVGTQGFAKKFDVALPLEEIEPEAVRAIIGYVSDEPVPDDDRQPALFE